jgi:hypothetical protein
MALYRKNCMTLFVDINVIATYDINDINLEVDINVSLPLGTMLALRALPVASGSISALAVHRRRHVRSRAVVFPAA